MPKAISVFKANSWKGVQNAVEAAASLLRLKPDEELWYRGVANRRHQLLPSLHRCFAKNDRGHKNIRKLETDLFFEFLAKARTGDGSAIDHWDVLFLMQHYRAPTRLLDWTGVLHVAIHFAIGYLPRGHTELPRIYVINPYLWNRKHGLDRDLAWPRYFTYDEKDDHFYEYGEILVEDLLDWKFPIALYPPQRDARLSAQRGYFTIHGYDPRSLDEISPNLIVAIDLQPEAVAEAKEALKYSGTYEYLLFPDLEGLARHLRTLYNI